MTGERRTYIEMAEMHVIVLYFMLRDFRISVLISLISLGPRLWPTKKCGHGAPIRHVLYHL